MDSTLIEGNNYALSNFYTSSISNKVRIKIIHKIYKMMNIFTKTKFVIYYSIISTTSKKYSRKNIIIKFVFSSLKFLCFVLCTNSNKTE